MDVKLEAACFLEMENTRVATTATEMKKTSLAISSTKISATNRNVPLNRPSRLRWGR